jgi:FKBP-type peptidyl-prolyl cis-trans isomerase
MNPVVTSALMIAALIAAGCGQTESEAPAEQAVTQVTCPQPDSDGVIAVEPGLVARILKPGYGRAAQSKDYADVHATLWLYDESGDDGRGAEIWSSGGAQPFQFQIDSGQVIAGWDLGVKCMLVGEKRRLRISPELAYGERGKPPVPPNATLLFEIELVRLTAPL